MTPGTISVSLIPQKITKLMIFIKKKGLYIEKYAYNLLY